jgi:hypothetical protein
MVNKQRAKKLDLFLSDVNENLVMGKVVFKNAMSNNVSHIGNQNTQ